DPTSAEPERTEDRRQLIAMLRRPEIEERMGRQEVLRDPAVVPDVDGGIDRSRPVRLDRQRDAVRPAIVEERREGDDARLPDAVLRGDRDDAREVSPLVPELGRPLELVEAERQDVAIPDRIARNDRTEVVGGDPLG